MVQGMWPRSFRLVASGCWRLVLVVAGATWVAEGRSAVAQIFVDTTMLASGYSETFDSMGASPSAGLPTGWKMTAAGAGTTAGWGTTTNVTVVTQQASSGTPTTGGRYNWGASVTDRAAGFMTSGGYASPNALLFGLTNTTASTITGLTLAFDYERYRINTAAASVAFFASMDGTNWTAVTAGDSGAFSTGASSYTFTGGTVVQKSGITLSSLNIGQNQSYYLKWNFNTTGSSSQGLGLDNVSVAFTAVEGDVAYYWVGADTTLGGAGSWSQTGGTSWRTTNTDGPGQAWDQAKLATFGGASGGAVTVGDTVRADAGLRFTATGYTLAGGTLQLGGLSAAANTILTDTAIVAVIDSVLSGSSSLTKAGQGTLVLGGANTFSGGLTIGAGTVQIAAASALGDIGNAVAFGGGTLRTTATLDVGSRPLSGAASLDIAPGTTLTTSAAATLSGLTLTNTGTLALAGSGNTVGNISSTGISGTARVAGNLDFGTAGRIVTVASGGTLELAGNLTGSGIIEKQGAGRLLLSGDNTGLTRIRLGTQGTTPVAGGTLAVSTPTALGSQQVFFNNGTIEATQPLTFANGLSIAGRQNGASRLAGAAMTFQGDATTFNPSGAAGDVTLVVDNDTTFAGAFTAIGTPLAVSGSGTLRITGNASGLTAPVSVSGGATLSVQGTATLGSSALTVASGGTLAGDGTVGSLAVNSGGTIAPGMSPGTLRAGNTTLAPGGNYNFQITDAAGSAGLGWDLLDVTGTLNVTATPADPFKVNLWSLASTNPDVSGDAANFNNQSSYAWTFARASGGITGFSASSFMVNTAAGNGTAGFTNNLAGGAFSVAAAGSDLNVVFTPFIPGTTLDWYGNGSTAGGSGSWTSLGSNWSPDGGATIGTWTASRTGVFGGSGGSVAVQSGGISAARGLDFRADGYAVTGGTITLSGATAADNAITVGFGATTSVSASLAGSAGMTKAGPGTLVLSGTSAYTGGTTVAGGELQVGNGSSGSIGGDVAVATGARLAFNPGSAGSFAGAISGSGIVAKEGSGSLVLSGANTHSGGTRLEGGSLTANGSSAFGTGAVTALDGGLYAAAGASVSNTITVGQVPTSTPTPVLLAGWDFQTTTSGGTAVVAAPNTPNAYAANLGTGTLRLDGTNGSSAWSAAELDGFTGTTVNAGAGFATSTTSPAALALVGSGANGQQAVFAVDMTGSSLLDVSYATRYSGADAFTSHEWAVSTDGVVWQTVGTETVSSTSFTAKTLPTISALAGDSTAYVRLTVNGATSTTANNRLDNIQLLATPGSLPTVPVVLGTESTGGTATFSGNVVLNQNLVVSAPAGGRAEFSGVIADGFGQNGVTKAGAGTVVLGGANTYAGPTTVTAGTLLVNGSVGAAGVIATGGAVGGTGTVGPLWVNSGGQVSPGAAGPGTLTAGATTLAGGGSYAFQIADAAGVAGTGWDLLDVGSLTVTATTAAPFQVDLWTVGTGGASGPASGFNPLQPYRWTLLDAGSSLSGVDLTAFTVNAAATASTGGFANATQGGTFTVALSELGNGLDVLFTPDAAASSLVWYGDDASPGGKGDWTSLNVNWFNGSALQAWDASRTASFNTVGGEVTIGPAGISAGNGVSFSAADYVVQGGTLTLSAPSRLVNSITVADGISSTIAAPLAGAAGLTKAGSGTLVLTSTSAVGGGIVVGAGTLQLGAGGTTGSLVGDFQLGSAGTLAVDRSDGLTVAGSITGLGRLLKQGVGVLTLTGANDYTGGTTVANGTVVVGDGSSAGSITTSGTVDVAAGATLAFDRADTTSFTGRVVGSGVLEQRGSGVLTLSRSFAYGPDFTLAVADGTVDLNRGGASLADILGAGNTVTLAGGTLQLTSNAGDETRINAGLIDVRAGSTLAIQRLNATNPGDHSTTNFAAPISVANDSTLTFDFRGEISGTFTGRTTYTAPVTLASDAAFAVTNSAGGNAEVIFAGPVGDGGAGHGLLKSGPQRLTLSGTNTYSGDTAVAAGTLALGVAGTINASPLVGVASGATFDVSAKTGGYVVPTGQTIAGDGGVTGAIAFATGSTVAPGDPVGTLTTSGDVTFGGGGNYNWQIVDAAGTAGAAAGWDLLSVGGALSIAANSTTPFAINLWSLASANPLTSGSAANFDATRAGSWRIASATGGITGFAADAFTVNVAAANGTAGFANAVGSGSFSVAVSGNDLNLVYAPGAPTNDIVINVPTGSQTQAQAGYPLITTADSVTKTGAGTVVFDAANTYTGPTTISAGTLQVANANALATTGVTVAAGATLAATPGTTIKAPSVTLDGGTLSAGTVAVNSATGIETLLVNAGTVSSTAALVVGPGGLVNLPLESRVGIGVASLAVTQSAGGGLLDIGAGQVTVAAGGISAADLRADIIAGFNGGGWNGAAGITSAAAAASNGTRAVGYVADGAGARVSFAAPGDTNLDGFVDLLDLLEILGSGTYEAPVPAVWSQGDFNYDGTTDLLDLLAILGSGTYDQGNYFPAAATGGTGLAGNVAAVPEPGTLGLVAGAGLAALALARRPRSR